MSIPSPLFNCQQATLLIERRADEPMPAKTSAQLWAHLRRCPYCRRYSFQSPFIVRSAKAAAEAAVPADLQLPASLRARLQQLVDPHDARPQEELLSFQWAVRPPYLRRLPVRIPIHLSLFTLLFSSANSSLLLAFTLLVAPLAHAQDGGKMQDGKMTKDKMSDGKMSDSKK